VAYNEEQEEIAIQARKQTELARIDELRKHEQLKKAGKASQAHNLLFLAWAKLSSALPF